MQPSVPASLSIERLRSQVSGRVVGPDDSAYDELRAIGEGGYRPSSRRHRATGGRAATWPSSWTWRGRPDSSWPYGPAVTARPGTARRTAASSWTCAT